ncbi:hypothetical protein CHUAL_005397 [Chamberlinius hualienensis]
MTTVDDVTERLRRGWTAHLDTEGRIYYCNHATQTSSWLPPCDSWDSKRSGLPYGWEIAVDKDSKQYFINHLNKTTTYEDPRKELIEDAPRPRDVELIRHPEMGFGFVAGSEKPVIVRFVTEGGPSHGKLLPGDQILKVNGEDVKKAPRDHAIDLVKACKHSVVLSVCQPETDSSCRKSALLSAAKKARLKSNPSRVRFAEGVVINGSPLFSPSNYTTESCIPFMPNVLKVFLENGQTRSFKYDNATLVGDVLGSLQMKLSIKRIEHFSLVVEHIKSLRRNKLTLLDPKECLAKVAARPGAQHLRCLFRVTFVPRDGYDLLKDDPVTFEYLYTQCCNDVVQERFAPELKYDIALRLAALHMQEHYLSNISNSLTTPISSPTKFSVKAMERDCGLENFVPVSLTETMKRKELRKLLGHFLKLNQSLSAPGQKTLTALQAQLHYLRIMNELPSYGAKCFTTNLRNWREKKGPRKEKQSDSNMETVILVSPKFGISQIAGIRNAMPMTLANIEDLSEIIINKEDELSQQIELQMKDLDKENILLSLEERDSEELVLFLQGYYNLLTNRTLPVQQEKDRWSEDGAPPYQTKHTVKEAGWNYVDTSSSATANCPSETYDVTKEHQIDLSLGPPPYHSAIRAVTANGHINTLTMVNAKGSDDNSSCNFEDNVDKNMNRTLLITPSERNVAKDNVERCVTKAATTTSTSIAPEVSSSSSLSSMTSELAITAATKHNLSSTKTTTSALSAAQLQHVLQMEIRDGEKHSDATTISAANIAPLTVEEPKRTPVSIEEKLKTEMTTNAADVVRRVAEMQQIVLDAEMYLTEEEATDTDLDSSRGELNLTDLQDGVHPLKAADSLLLLNQIGRESDIEETVKTISLIDQSESDTDSMSTPTDSPSHRPSIVDKKLLRPHQQTVTRSGSSFGLHSPDTFHKDHNGRLLEKTNLQELFQKIQESQLPYQFAEGTFYLDPDIIDLTMIPPPITPDQEEAPSAVSFPPTPFADRQTLEAELMQNNALSSKIQLSFLHNNLYSISSSSPLTRVAIINPNRSAEAVTEASSGSNWTSSREDIDKFIASVAVPPPPTVGTGVVEVEPLEMQNVIELTQEQISAYIIPPPPPTSSSSDSETEMITRLQSVAASVEEIVKNKNDMEFNKEAVTLNVCYDISTPMSSANSVNYSNFCSKSDSSGYETYSSAELKPIINNRRILNNSFSDNSSTISCSSSGTTNTELASGSQADTEDNSVDLEDYSSNHPKTATTNGGILNSQLPNGGLKPPGAGSRLVARCNSSSSEDGGNNNGGNRRSGIPCHSFATVNRKTSSKSAITRLNGNVRSSSTDNLTKGSSNSEMNTSMTSSDANFKSFSNQPQWSSSSESLATAAAIVANDRRISTSNGVGGGAMPKSPINNSSSTLPTSATKSLNRKVANGIKQGPLPHGGQKQQTNLQEMQGVVEDQLLQQKQEDGYRSDKTLLYRRKSSSLKLKKVVTSETTSLTTENSSPKSGRHFKSRLQLPATFKHANDIVGLSNGGSTNTALKQPSKLPRSFSINRPMTSFKQNGGSNGTNGNLVAGGVTTVPVLQCLSLNRCDDVIKYGGSSCKVVKCRRDSFYGAEEAISNMLLRLDDVIAGVGGASNVIQGETKVLQVKGDLINCSKQFVTASKMFVKGATESEDRLVECLINCLQLLDEMFVNTEKLAVITSSSCTSSNNTSLNIEMHDLVLKIKDVAITFLHTLQAASEAVGGKNINSPNVNVLMQQATTLASVLTALMRTLRLFKN